MALVTLRIIDGPNSGKVFDELSCPITIGRDEGNVVELNDERISRFHLKIFEESGNLVLVDLGSTNGTQVNGEPIHLWVLRPGDLIQVGKTLILFGTKDEILHRLKENRVDDSTESIGVMGRLPDDDDLTGFGGKRESTGFEVTSLSLLEQEFFSDLKPTDLQSLRSLSPPRLPNDLSTLQKAQISELLVYFILRFRSIVSGIESLETPDDNVKGLFDAVKVDVGKKGNRSRRDEKEDDSKSDGRIILSDRKWQNLLDLYSLFSAYLDKLSHR